MFKIGDRVVPSKEGLIEFPTCLMKNKEYIVSSIEPAFYHHHKQLIGLKEYPNKHFNSRFKLVKRKPITLKDLVGRK